MIVPVVIPVSPPQCPGCKAIENQKTVCRACGYEYGDEPGGCVSDILIVMLLLALIVIIGWASMTLFIWFMDGDKPLLTMLQGQFKWLVARFSQLRLW